MRAVVGTTRGKEGGGDSPDQVLGDTGCGLFVIAQLLVGGASGVDDQGLCVTDVGQVGRKLEVVDERGTLGGVTLDTEAEHTSETVLEVLLRERVRRMRGKTWVRDPGDARVGLEPLGEGECVVDVALHTQREGLETLEEEERAEWVEGGAEVAEEHDADVDGKGDCAKSVPELEAVVSLRGLGELREPAALFPVELCGRTGREEC